MSGKLPIPSCCDPGEKAPLLECREWVDSKVSLDTLKKRNITCLCWMLNHASSVALLLCQLMYCGISKHGSSIFVTVQWKSYRGMQSICLVLYSLPLLLNLFQCLPDVTSWYVAMPTLQVMLQPLFFILSSLHWIKWWNVPQVSNNDKTPKCAGTELWKLNLT
jgi:hypothetical protein